MQHFGRKDPIRSVEDINTMYARLDSLFVLDKIYYHTGGVKTSYMQDIGLDLV